MATKMVAAWSAERRSLYFQAITVHVFFGYSGAAIIFVYHQNGKYLANSWSSPRRAVESSHKFYSVRFYIDATFELSLIRL